MCQATGPFTITNVTSHVAYQLNLPRNWKIHNVFHASLLSPYKEMEEHGVETDVCTASPRLDSLMLKGLVELAQTLLKGHLMLQDNYRLYTDYIWT